MSRTRTRASVGKKEDTDSEKDTGGIYGIEN